MSAAHTVTVTLDKRSESRDVKFTCSGDRSSECHIYPDADEWEEGDGQERTPHEECWLQGWFDNDAYSYFGPDAIDDGGQEGVPLADRSGEIEFEYYQGGHGLTWWWKGGLVFPGNEETDE